MQIKTKSPEEIKIMAEGGAKLGKVKKALKDKVSEGVSAYDIEQLATTLIEKSGGVPSFKKVPKYHWSTCVNVNEGLVHGIPKKEVVFKKGDVVSVDVGMYYKGFHTDTSFTKQVGSDKETKEFLETGTKALKAAIDKARAGNRIYDISNAIDKTVSEKGYSPIKALVGHGVGRELHEEPQIPCFVFGKKLRSPEIPEGAVLAIEVMYAKGAPDVAISPDGWTILMADGKISALFEETVAITSRGPLVLTG